MSLDSATIQRPSPSFEVRGEQVEVPVQVRSATMVGATFTVPATAAQKLIEYSGLRVQRVAGTLGLCMLSAVQYADNDLGPYNEIALALAVEPHDGSPSGSLVRGDVTTFIHRLPVNQPFTCDAGREVWGFPKWVCDISIRHQRRRTDVVMMDGDEVVLSMRVDGPSFPVPDSTLEMSCYSWRDGVLRTTPWTMKLTGVRMLPGGVEVAIGERHPMAQELRALGFPKRALASQDVRHLECSFGAAEAVEPAER